MKIILRYLYQADSPVAKEVAARYPNAVNLDRNGLFINVNINVINNSPEHFALKEYLNSLGVSPEPYETRKGDFEKKDYDRAKYFRGGAKKCRPTGSFSALLNGKKILSKPLPKFRYGIDTIVKDEVKQALEAESFSGLLFLPVYLSKQSFYDKKQLVNPELELIPGVYALYSSVLLPHASVPNPLYKDLKPKVRSNLYSIEDFRSLGFPDACLAPSDYWRHSENRSNEAIDTNDHHWIFYSKRFCNFLTSKFKEFEWEPEILAEDAL